MKAIIKYKIFVFSLLLLLCSIKTIRAQVFANVDLNRKWVYVQQPFHVTITVYTRTWFTAPLEFGNLQIPNAFIVPFDKTQPGMFTVGGKQYPGIQFYYIVFPYKAGEFTVPPIEITAQSPPEGSSQSRKIVLKTTPHAYTVKDVPKELKKMGNWFVAKNVILHETWTPSSHDFKVGDVIKRTITIDAKGTLPQFIPELDLQKDLEWASVYPQDAVLTDTRGGGDANGRSVQTITYLLEQDGDFTVPAIGLSFWNPYAAKVETKTIQSLRIHVDKNPDLGILTTLKDSLDATVKPKAEVAQVKTPFRILGMTWYAFAGCVIAAILVIYILGKTGQRIYGFAKLEYENYRNSEAYLFRKFQYVSDNPKTFLSALYKWWDRFPGKTSASVGSTLDHAGKGKEGQEFKEYFEKTLHEKSGNNTKKIKQTLKDFREETKQENQSSTPTLL